MPGAVERRGLGGEEIAQDRSWFVSLRLDDGCRQKDAMVGNSEVCPPHFSIRRELLELRDLLLDIGF
jgi:hypothetical protein